MKPRRKRIRRKKTETQSSGIIRVRGIGVEIVTIVTWFYNLRYPGYSVTDLKIVECGNDHTWVSVERQNDASQKDNEELHIIWLISEVVIIWTNERFQSETVILHVDEPFGYQLRQPECHIPVLDEE